MRAAAISRGADWRLALDKAIDEAFSRQAPAAGGIDLTLFFASADHSDDFPVLLEEVGRRTGASLVAGCSGQGIIGPEREVEGEPALSLLVLNLPGATLRGFHFTQEHLLEAEDADYWPRKTGLEPEEVNAWLVFADPFRLDCEAFLSSLSAAYPKVPIVGGLASGGTASQGTHVFLNGQVHAQGVVALAFGGDYTIKSVVSQGCDPIGEPWIITGARGSIVETISQRPAYQVLVETIEALPPDARRRASRNLLVGLAMNEYNEHFGRGDFLIRNLMGADPETGAIAVGAYPRVGQTIQFQIRDAQAADEDLRHLLDEAREGLDGIRPAGALLCSCNGRGQGLFGFPDHDARSVAQQLGAVPLAGFFCNGEIGPVGQKNFLHGFTASLALIVPR